MDDVQKQQVPVSPQPSPPASLPVRTGGNKKKWWMIGGIIALVVAGIAAFGVYAYITNTPDYLLNKSIENLGKQSAAAAKFKLLSGTEANGMTISGDVAVRADEANKQNGEVVVGVGTGDSRVSLMARVIDGSLYTRAGSLDNFQRLVSTFSADAAETYNTPEFAAALKRIDGVWFFMTKEEFEDLAKSSGRDEVTDAPTPEEMKKVWEIYQRHPFLRADKTFSDEAIEGVNTAHFSIRLDRNQLVAFLQDLKAANLKSIKVTDADIEDAKKESETLEDGSLEVWVTRGEPKLKQVKVTSTEKGSESALTLTMATELPKLEKLEKPEGAKPMSELLTTFLGPLYTQPEQFRRSNRI
ncbi:MAG: hypothetical protein ACREGJ_02630 [Candidatus Saccharimonadales bacterium]